MILLILEQLLSRAHDGGGERVWRVVALYPILLAEAQRISLACHARTIDLLRMRFLVTPLTIFLAAPLYGQNVASRQLAKQNFQNLLANQKPVSWVQTPTDPEHSTQSTHVIASIAEVNI